MKELLGAVLFTVWLWAVCVLISSVACSSLPPKRNAPVNPSSLKPQVQDEGVLRKEREWVEERCKVLRAEGIQCSADS